MIMQIAALFFTSILLISGFASTVLADSMEYDPFSSTWERTDWPVFAGESARTWMWGPDRFQPSITEQYADAPDSERLVKYHDKARMEITNPNADPNSIWYVTNGLLVVELITGQMQVGDNSFENRNPAEVNVAGDGDDTNGPTYATFGSLLNEAPQPIGSIITERVDRQGIVTNDPALAGQGIVIGHLDEVTSHAIVSPFWDFMNSSGTVYKNGQFVNELLFENAYFATGRPITEAYWADVKVGGQQRDVLMQCFERRCLTYTPGNPEGFIVEAGNVGQHYYEWRYGDTDDGGNDGGGDSTPTPLPTPTPHPSPTPSPTPEPTDGPATEYEFAGKFGLPSLNVDLVSPHKSAVAPTGEIYVSNSGRNQILKFDPDGILIAKWGSQGSGNGQFNTPVGVAVDSAGDVFVADFGNHRIQKFDANGAFITTWGAVGASQGNFDGPWDVAISNNDILYVTELNNNRVQSFQSDGKPLQKWGATGSADGEFLSPMGIDVSDAGHVYVADTANNRFQIFGGKGTWISSHGSFGSGDGQFNILTDLAVASDGSIWTTELGTDRVQIFSSTYAHEQTLDAAFSNPMGVAFNLTEDRVYIADAENNRVQVFRGALLDDKWTTGSRGRFATNSPTAFAMGPDGLLYIVDRGEGEIKVLTPEGVQVDRIDFQLTSKLRLDEPLALAIDDNGNLYIPDNALQIVVKVDAEGRYIAQFGESGDNNGQFSNVKAIALDDSGNIYVGDDKGVQKFGPDFSFIASSRIFGKATSIALYGERLYVTNAGSDDHVSVYDHDLNLIWAWGVNFDDPSGITFDAAGSVYVSDSKGLLQKFALTKSAEQNGVERIAQIGHPGDADGEIGPSGYPGIEVIADAAGLIYVTDPGNQRVQVFRPVD